MSDDRARWALKKYGITLEQREALRSAQDNCCVICGKRNPGHHGLVIDHCHTTQRIRGLLCGKCNSGLGMFNDDPILMEAAARYLERAALQRGFLPDAA